MRILFVNPPQHQLLQGNNPKIIEKERGKNPPLGLLYVASTVNSVGRHSATIVDANLDGLGKDELREVIIDSRCDVLGVTLTSFTLLDALAVISVFKNLKPDGKVIVGGPHAAIFPKETVGLGVVDVAVKREGEAVINEILDNIEKPERLKGVNGICFQWNGDIIDTGDAPYIRNLDALPTPDRRLLPYRRYYSLLGGDSYSTTLFTSRGCPYRCAFCDRPALGKQFRFHSADYVLQEIRECVDLGISEFLVYDDTFTVNRKRVKEICDSIRENGLDIRWDIRARVDTVDEEMLQWLHSAGCKAVHYGVESGSERILDRLNKGITIPDVKKAFSWTRDAGMETLAYFMIGSPGETREDIDKTIELISEIDPGFLHMTIFTPFPATQLYQEALDAFLISEDVWRAYACRPTDRFVPPTWTENFTKEELQEIIVKTYKRFYLRPRYVWRRLTALRSPSEFRRQLKAGISVLRMA